MAAKTVFSLLFLLALIGCSSFQAAPNRLIVEKRWARNTVATDYLGGRRIHRFQPILTDAMVIVGNAIDGLVAYDRNTASVRWRLNIKDGVESGGQLAEDILYFGAGDGQFYAVQVESGAVLWTYPLKAEGLGRPSIKGGIVYVLGGNNVAHALNAKTGKLVWVYNRREAGNISVRGASQPAVTDDLVIIGFSDGFLLALNRSSGAVVWEAILNRNKRFKDVDSTPVIDGDMIFVSSYDGALYAVQKKDGAIKWSVEEGGYEEVLVSGPSLFYSSTTGKIMAIDKASGKVIWSKDNPRGIATGPVLYRGVLAFGEMQGALRFVDARTGEFLTVFDPGRGVTAKVIADPKRGEIYMLSHEANLFALRVDWRRFSKQWPWE